MYNYISFVAVMNIICFNLKKNTRVEISTLIITDAGYHRQRKKFHTPYVDNYNVTYFV